MSNPSNSINNCYYEALKQNFLYECGCDINVNNSQGLCEAMARDYFDVAKFLIDLGIKITNQVIMSSTGNPKNLLILLDSGIGAESVAKIIWSDMKRTQRYVDRFTAYFKELVNHGVDFNQIVVI